LLLMARNVLVNYARIGRARRWRWWARIKEAGGAAEAIARGHLG